MRIRTALAATALGALVVLGGATTANADNHDKFNVGGGTGSQGNEGWAGPAISDPAGPAFGGEGSVDIGQGQGEGQGFGGAEESPLGL
ncbi:hypothetical protein ACFY1L_51620 [Streptomyces sp. NPDC001663]|uniref:hypothetical protein n=1 Tax=Streptomyces sp. NPDC001663 TaxID=3364597 RepID=UPI0036AA67A1